MFTKQIYNNECSCDIYIYIYNVIFQQLYAAHSIHTHGCVHSLVHEVRQHLIILGVIALGVGFIEVGTSS